jgi:hypothetical protein
MRMTTEQKRKRREFLDKLHEYPNLKKVSRKELRLLAKAKGIYNFAVLNKKELLEILQEYTPHSRINDIVLEAYGRWQRTCCHRKSARNRRT